MLQYKVFSHHHVLSLVLLSPFSFFSLLLPSPLPCGHGQGPTSIEEMLLCFRGRWELGWVTLPRAQTTKTSCLCASDRAQDLGKIVTIYKEFYGGAISRKRVATLESNKSILAFPVSSFIWKDACLCFKAEDFSSVFLCSSGVHICACQKVGAGTPCSR